MINGNSLKVQFGKESSYGTLATPDKQVKVASEQFKPTFNKKEEGLLTGSKGAGKKQIMSLKVDGSISTLFRPDDGLFLLSALGEEDTVQEVGDSAYKHTFKAVGTAESDRLPSLCAYVDRKTDIFTYNGLKVDSISFAAQPEDYLKVDLTFVGRDEGTGGTLGNLSPSPLKAFKFRHGKVLVAGTEIADITSIKFDYNNALNSAFTTSSGLYATESECGTRTIQTQLEMLYTSKTEALRKLYKTDDTVEIQIIFTSDEEIEEGIPYSLKITIPCNQVSDAAANFGSQDAIKQTMSFEAVDNGNELITVELINGQSEKY